VVGASSSDGEDMANTNENVHYDQKYENSFRQVKNSHFSDKNFNVIDQQKSFNYIP
jgi:hypothetical protein